MPTHGQWLRDIMSSLRLEKTCCLLYLQLITKYSGRSEGLSLNSSQSRKVNMFVLVELT